MIGRNVQICSVIPKRSEEIIEVVKALPKLPNVSKCSQNVQLFPNVSEEIIEVVKALPKFPNRNSGPQLLGQVQS